MHDWSWSMANNPLVTHMTVQAHACIQKRHTRYCQVVLHTSTPQSCTPNPWQQISIPCISQGESSEQYLGSHNSESIFAWDTRQSTPNGLCWQEWGRKRHDNPVSMREKKSEGLGSRNMQIGDASEPEQACRRWCLCFSHSSHSHTSQQYHATETGQEFEKKNE